MLALATATDFRPVAIDDLTLSAGIRSLIGAGAAADEDAAATLLFAWLAAGAQAGVALPDGAVADLIRAVRPDAVPAPSEAALAVLQKLGMNRLLQRVLDLQDEWQGAQTGQAPFLFRVENGLPVLVRLTELLETRPVHLGLNPSRSQVLDGAAGTRLTVMAEASLGISIDVLGPESSGSQFGLTLPTGRALLVLRAQGEIAGGLDFAAGSTQFAASASHTRELAVVSEHPAGESSVRALVSASESAAVPLDPQALHVALAPAGASGLRLVRLSRARGFAATLGAEGGVGFVDVRQVDAKGRSFPIETRVAATLKLAVRHADSRQRELRILRSNTGLRLETRILDSTETAGTLGIGVGLTISGWGDVAGHLVAAHLPDTEGLRKQLAPALKPGSWLKDQLKALLEHHLPAELDALAGLITGDLSGAGAAELLLGPIVEALDTRVQAWRAVADQRLDALVLAVAEAISPQASLRAPLATALEQALGAGKFLDQLEDKLAQHLKSMKSKALESLAEQLSDVGVAVQKTAGKADALMAPVLAFLDRYDALRGKVLAAAEKLATLRFGVAIEHERSRSAEDRLDYAFDIPAARLGDPVVRRDFQAWLTGRRFADEAAPFGLAQGDANWRVVSKRAASFSTAIRFDLFTGNASSRELLGASTLVELGPGGVLCARTKASASKEYALSWTQEKVSALASALFDALLPEQPQSAFSLDLEFKDGQFRDAELESILESVDRAGIRELLSPALRERLWSQWEALFAANGRKPPAAKLRLGLLLDEEGRARLQALARDPAELKASLVESMRAACRGVPGADLDAACRTLGYEDDVVTAFSRRWQAFERNWHIRRIEHFTGVSSVKGGDLYHAGRAIQRAIRPLDGVYRALMLSRDWPDAAARQRQIAATVAASHPKKSSVEQALLASRALADELQARGEAFAEALGNSIAANDALADLQTNVPIPSLFLLIALARATGAEMVGEVVS